MIPFYFKKFYQANYYLLHWHIYFRIFLSRVFSTVLLQVRRPQPSSGSPSRSAAASVHPTECWVLEAADGLWEDSVQQKHGEDGEHGEWRPACCPAGLGRLNWVLGQRVMDRNGSCRLRFSCLFSAERGETSKAPQHKWERGQMG